VIAFAALAAGLLCWGRARGFSAPAKICKKCAGPKTEGGCNCGRLFLSRDEKDNRENRRPGISATALRSTVHEFWPRRFHMLLASAGKRFVRLRGSAGIRRPEDHVSPIREREASLK